MFAWLFKKLTKDYKEVPLFYVTFDLEYYKEHGKENSCHLHYHPDLHNDEYVQSSINNIINHIRDNYDMEKLSKL